MMLARRKIPVPYQELSPRKMLIVGQAGSGPKDRTDRPLGEEKGREESASREVGHAGNCARADWGR